MSDKTALNTSHPLYSNWVYVLGIVDNGDETYTLKNLVDDTEVGSLGANASIINDETLGLCISSPGTSGGINLGDRYLDGLTECMVLIQQVSDEDPNSTTRLILNKYGAGNDTARIQWQTSNARIEYRVLNDAQAANVTLVNNALSGIATSAHTTGFIFNGNSGSERFASKVNDTATEDLTIFTGALANSALNLTIHDTWDGLLSILAIADIEDETNYDLLVSDPLDIYATASEPEPDPSTVPIIHKGQLGKKYLTI